MTNVVRIKASERSATIKADSMGAYIAPEHLQEFISPCQTRVITFKSEKSLKSYRAMIYSINRQGEYQWCTRRDTQSMWGLVIFRMK
jgi:hypothetical protein